MTEWIVDISEHQQGLDLAQVKREGFAAVLARASTGVNGGRADYQWANFKRSARAAGLPLGAYHYLYPSKHLSIAKQVAVCAAAIGDTSIPVMIDHENADQVGVPTVADAYAFRDGMKAKGYAVPLWYLPRGWIWPQLGSPSLKGCGMDLVASNYVSGSDFASELYPGDSGVGWNPYGGLTPAIWQFTDAAKVAGHLIDANAFRGSHDELMALLTGDDVAITKADVGTIFNTDGEVPAPDRALKENPTNKQWAAAAFLRENYDWERTNNDLLTQLISLAQAQQQQITALQAAVAAKEQIDYSQLAKAVVQEWTTPSA